MEDEPQREDKHLKKRPPEDSRSKRREALLPSFRALLSPLGRLSPEEGLQHEWIIKGLPPNILYHNQRFASNHPRNNNSSSTMQN